MDKIKRATKDYGGGSGKRIFDSDLFSVTVWNLSGGIRTTISSRVYSDMEIHFDGEHDFTSDETCINQFTPSEILYMLDQTQVMSFEGGRLSKASEIRLALDI